MKTIKIKLDEETMWLANIHPQKRLALIKYALKKLTRNEIFELLEMGERQVEDVEEKVEVRDQNEGKGLQEFENW